METIRWPSKDGEEIEGALRKPPNFDPSKRHALLFVVHGGPVANSTTSLLDRRSRMYYPEVQWANEGVLVLKPNYRGSDGRGQAFTDLNLKNLGVHWGEASIPPPLPPRHRRASRSSCAACPKLWPSQVGVVLMVKQSGTPQQNPA